MKENNKTAKVAAVLLLICAIIHLILSANSYGMDIFRVLGIMSNISLIVLAVLLFMGRKTKILIAPLGLVLAVQVLRCISHPNIGYEMVINLNFIVNMIIELLSLVIYILLILAVINKDIKVNKIIFTLVIAGKVFFNILSFVIVIIYVGINVFGEQLAALHMLGIFVGTILEPIAFLLMYMWLTPADNRWSDKKEDISEMTAEGEGNTYIKGVPVKSGHIDMLMHILLLVFTCGIWNLVWIYKTTDYLNCVEDEPYQNPGSKLLLCMFIPFYSIYWVYKNAARIDKLAKNNDVYSDITTIATVMAVILNIVAPIIMQEKINVIEDNRLHSDEISD